MKIEHTMATVKTHKLGIRRFLEFHAVNWRNEATETPYNQAQPSISVPNQLLAAIPGEWSPQKVYVAEIDGCICGYAAVRKRTDQYRWDVQILGTETRLTSQNEEITLDLWTALLDRIIGEAASAGAKRIFAQAPEKSIAHDCFKQVGFESYSTLSIVSGSSDQSSSPPDGFRRMHPSDVWSVHQLYNRSIPPIVQYAEATTSADWDLPINTLRTRLKLGSMSTLQYVVDAAHGVSAFCRVTSDTGKTDVFFLAGELSGDFLFNFVSTSLRASGVSREQLVTIGIPGFQRDYLGRFVSAGYQSQSVQINMVKHTTAPVIVHPQLQPIPAIESMAQTVNGITISNSGNGKIVSSLTTLNNEYTRTETITH